MKKPFPEGTDEATLCEAIDSKEPDLWVRFGHIVPAYITGALYILETGPEKKDKLYQYIANDYVYRYHSQQASCRGNLTLLYIRKMFDKSEYRGKPFGREHLSQAIEKKFGIKTRESFQVRPDEERLSDYCRADAELCDRLVKLDFPNNGTGLCSFALSSAGAGADADEEKLGHICEGLPPFLKVCPYIKWRRDEWPDRQKCDCRLRDALGLPRVPQCER